MRAAMAEGPPERKRGPAGGPASELNPNVAALCRASSTPRQRAARYLRRRFGLAWPVSFVIADLLDGGPADG
jgi:hypothetical protein